MSVLFDTNILIDLTHGVPEARKLFRIHRGAAISIISRVEVLSGTGIDPVAVGDLLRTLTHLPVTLDVANAAAAIRRDLRLRLPDAIILATAQAHGLTLLTRDAKDFGKLANVSVPYRL